MSTTTQEPGTALVVIPTGETIALQGTDSEALAAFVDGPIADALEQLTAAAKAIKAELLGRLDRDGLWTQRFGDPAELGYQFEVKAPSPTAGTKRLNETKLKETLEQLVADETISELAAGNALQTKVTVVFAVPWGADPQEIIDLAWKDDRVTSAEASTAPRQAGINALEAMGNKVKRAIARCKVRATPPTRSVSIKRLEKNKR